MGSVAAQERAAATSEQQAMMETKIAMASQKMNSMVCDFEQIKKSSLLSGEVVSRGKMFYRIGTMGDTASSSVKNISLRWEYADGYTFISNNDRVQMLSPTGTPINSIKMNRFFKEIINTTLMAVNGSQIADKTKFTAAFYIDKNYCYIALTPVQRELKNMFSVIELVFNARDYTGERVEITEKNGDKTVITLLNKKVNAKIDDNKFRIK
jgi:outer membrane lipoprotein-sorting protein